MQAAFQQAATPFRVLGLKMQPYTLGHDWLLYTLDSGFCRETNKPPTYDDLLISVWICAQKDHVAAIQRLAKPITRIWITLWSLYCGKFDVGEAFATFHEYIKAQTPDVEYWIESQGTKKPQSGTPFFQVLKVSMMRDMGMSEAEAWSTRYADAHLNFLTLLENMGKIRLISDHEKSVIAAANDPEQQRKLQEWADKVVPKKAK